MQQLVPSRRFQYKTIRKMQFEMRKMLFIRKRRFLSSNLDRIFQEYRPTQTERDLVTRREYRVFNVV